MDNLANATISVNLAWQIGMTLVIVVSCFFAVRFGLNGAREHIERVDRRTEEMQSDIKEILVSGSIRDARLAVAEANLNAHAGWIQRVEEKVS